MATWNYIPQAAPVNTVAPSISGVEAVGQTLTGSDGTWSNSPTSYTRKWYGAATSGGTFSELGTGSTYVQQPTDEGTYIKYGVVATNAAGSSSEVFSSEVGPVAAAGDPTTLPELALSNITLDRYFDLPGDPEYCYGGPIGVSEDGLSMYAGGGQTTGNGNKVYKFTIPTTNGAVAVPTIGLTTVTGDVDPTEGEARYLAGFHCYGGVLLATQYSYYDNASPGAYAGTSHKRLALDLSSQDSDYTKVGDLQAGCYGGYMGTIPTDWQPYFGNNPMFTGACNFAVVSRTSQGPSLHAFDPTDIDGSLTPVSATAMVCYPDPHEIASHETDNDYYHWADYFSGAFFPSGTNSIWLIGRHGYGDPPYYGSGTTNPALHGTPDGEGNLYCYDPLGVGDKGSHAYPYRYQVWAYRASDLLDVVNGVIEPWEVPLPTIIPFNLIGDGINDVSGAPGSATYHDGTRKLYWAIRMGAGVMRVYVFNVGTP